MPKPTVPKRRRRKSDLLPYQKLFFETGNFPDPKTDPDAFDGFLFKRDFPAQKKLWEIHGKEIIREWNKRHPGTDPYYVRKQKKIQT